MDYKEVGKLISKKRKEKKITKKKLAEILDVEEECITYWEKGKCLPFFNKMPQLSQTLDVPLYELMGNNEEVITNKLLKKCYLMMLFSIIVMVSYHTPFFILALGLFLIVGSFLLFKELKKLYN